MKNLDMKNLDLADIIGYGLTSLYFILMIITLVVNFMYDMGMFKL